MIKILNINILHFFSFLLAIFLAGFIQSSGFLLIKGLGPNISLIILLLAAFFSPNFIELLFYLFSSFFILSWRPELSPELCVLAVVTILAYFASRFLSLSKTINFIILVATGSALFYLFLSPLFLFHFPLIAIKEIFLNSLFAAILAFFISFFSSRFHFF